MAADTPLTLNWYGCDLVTGGIIEDLPALSPNGSLSKKLGQTTTSTFTLNLAGAPHDWLSATAHGRAVLVGVDSLTDLPVWAGIVLNRTRGSANTVELATATLESYLDNRYTGTYLAVQQDKATVVTGLAQTILTGGPPFVFDAPALGSVMDENILDGDDRTVLSALQEVMNAEGGPEWTIDVTWNAGHSGFQFPLRVRSAIGTQAASPEAVFDFPGAISTYSQAESFEAGKGATVIQARGEGEGSGRLSSAIYEATDMLAAGWPRWSYRFTPATGLTDPVALNAHAAAALKTMRTGASVWTVEAVASKAPRLGRDFSIGDTVRVAIERSPGHPDGAEVVARCWAWDLDPSSDSIRPILVEEDA